MQISREMMQHLAAAQTARQAADWSAQVTATLLPPQAAEPSARLAALTDAVIENLVTLHPQAALLATDVRQTAAWMQAELAAGVAYRETRAAALLQGAAALGALWFADERLGALNPLKPDEPAATTASPTLPPGVAPRLLANPQGKRFAEAASRERALRPGAQFALRQALAGGFTTPQARALVAAAFPAENDAERTARQQAAQRFIAQEQALQAQAAVADPDLRTLCMGGDLLLGLGRCVRLLSNPAAPHEHGALLTWLRSTINGLAGLTV